jgi:hypothetical protein
MRRRHASAAFSMQSYLQAVLDFTKELPEDAELDLGDIPGITLSPRASFSFVEEEVRAQLAYLPEAQLDDIVSRLRVFEGDVFETRTQPRPPPIRPGFDVPIVEREGSEPPARRPYPVAPHHQPELDRQVKALFDAGIIRCSSSNYSAPVLFTPKKDASLAWLLIIACSIRKRSETVSLRLLRAISLPRHAEPSCSLRLTYSAVFISFA